MSDERKSHTTLNLDVHSDNYVEVSAMDEKELCEHCQRMVYPDEANLSCCHDECPYFEGFEERRMIPVDIFMEGNHRVISEPDTEAPHGARYDEEED